MIEWEPDKIRDASVKDLLVLCRPLDEQLEVTKLRRDQTTAQGARRCSDAAPFVFRVGAAEVQDRIRALLRQIIGAWQISEGGWRIRYIRSVAELVAELSPHASWVEKHERGQEWREALVDVCLAALAQIDIPPEQVFIGRCGALDSEGGVCSVELWPVMGDAFATCPRCGSQWDVRERTDAALRRAESWAAPLSRVVEVLRASGEKVTVEQARNWTKRKNTDGSVMLQAVGVDAHGVRLYRLGTVREVLARRAHRAPAR